MPDPMFGRNETGLPENIFWHHGTVPPEVRARQFGHHPVTVWLTGLSGAGKSTLAYELEYMLLSGHHASTVLDGDNVRHHLNRDLGFSEADRTENIRRTAEVAHLFNNAGMIVIAAMISPYRADRAMARDIIGAERFVEVHVNASLAVCEARDCKGLYAKARSGQITQFTGISSPYEAPDSPSLVLDTGRLSLEAAVAALHAHLLHYLELGDTRHTADAALYI